MKSLVVDNAGHNSVPEGLVGASPATGPAAIQPNAANATTIPFNIFDISVLPPFLLLSATLARPRGLVARFGRPDAWSWTFAAGKQEDIYLLRLCGSDPTGAIAMSMQSVASPAYNFTPPKRNSLTHIPGDEGWPLIGKTLEVLADPKGHVERNFAKYGPVYRGHMFGETSLVLLGPDANELVLFDQAKQFSSTH